MKLKRFIALLLVICLVIPNALAAGNPVGEAAYVISGSVAPGEKGDAVKAMQSQLIVLGYLCGEPDDTYNDETTSAVKRFQSHYNEVAESAYLSAALNGRTGGEPILLNVDGVCDEMTYEALFISGSDLYLREWMIGDKGGEVTRLQNRLKTLGYLAGKPDGAFSSQTRMAIRAFQNEVGIVETGTANEETQKLLFSSDAPACEHAAVTMNDSGDAVEYVQKLLMQWGFMESSDADGAFGSDTRQAVKTAQAYLNSKGVRLGTAAQATVRSYQDNEMGIFYPVEDQGASESVDVTEQVRAENTAQPESSEPKGLSFNVGAGERIAYAGEDPDEINVTGTMDAMLLKYLSTESSLTFMNTLYQIGDKGNEVARIQRRLHSLCYVYDSADGLYGEDTRDAVKEFQKRNNLEETGICDEETLKVLFSASPRIGRLQYLIKVSTKAQRVYVYTYDDNDEYTILVKTMICSTGKNETPTPKGTFTNTRRSSRWYYFKEFDTWAQYAFIINGGILFHSVLYRSDDTSTLIRSSLNNLGKKASHGCIRLKVDDAKWIWNHCESHTTVIIY